MSEGLPPHAVVHVDLDGARAIHRAHGWHYPEGQTDTLFFTGLSNALEFFRAEGITATLFTIAEDLEDESRRRLLLDAVEEGHEIGSHSFHHRGLSGLGRDEKVREIFESRAAIQDRLGVPVDGFRAPAFDIDTESMDLIEEAGYAYDSSLFPTRDFAKKVGVERVEPTPHHVRERVLELPLPGHSPLPWPFHPCYSLVLGRWYFRTGLGRFEKTGHPLVLLFHLTDFAEPVSELRLGSLRQRMFTLSHLSASRKRSRCSEMMAAVKRRYEIVSTRALVGEYTKRERTGASR